MPAITDCHIMAPVAEVEPFRIEIVLEVCPDRRQLDLVPQFDRLFVSAGVGLSG